MAPHSANSEVHYYMLNEDYAMTTGKVAPWFGFDGGGEQFLKYADDGGKLTVDELLEKGVLKEITDDVIKGVIKIVK